MLSAKDILLADQFECVEPDGKKVKVILPRLVGPRVRHLVKHLFKTVINTVTIASHVFGVVFAYEMGKFVVGLLTK